MACASAGAVVAGDGPFNLLSAITVTDATGTPIFQPLSGYSLYLVNKYLPAGDVNTGIPRAYNNPQIGPEYNFAATGTTGTAVFRIDLEFEQDTATGYGSIPNLDSNASLQLKVDVAIYTVAWTGTTVSAATVTVRTTQHYWAPVGRDSDGVPTADKPFGVGDYLETRYETQTVSAAAENLVTVTNRGGLVRGAILVSRNAGARTAYGATSNVGVVLDNIPVDEGLPFEEQLDRMRRTYGYFGADLTTSYAPLTAGVQAGLDRGVIAEYFGAMSAGRDSWMNTRVGSLLQYRITPGASATTLEIITQLMQVKYPAAFYALPGQQVGAL
jgi:hypothetical protein